MLLRWFLIFSLAVTPASAAPCRKIYETLRQELALGALQFLIYPVYPWTVHRQVRPSSPRWIRIEIEENRGSLLETYVNELLTYRGMAASALYFAFVFGGQTVALTDAALREATPEFDDFGDDELFIIISATGDSNREVAHHSEAHQKARGKRKVYLIESTNLAVVRAEVERITALEGPAARMELHAHGTGGGVGFGGTLVPVDEVFADVPAVLAPKAQLRFHSCKVGRGEKGEENLRKLLAKMPEGSEVIAPSITLTPYEQVDLLRAFPVAHLAFAVKSFSLWQMPLYYVDPKSKIVRMRKE